MKKGFAVLPAQALLLSAGCSRKAEQPAPTVPETTALPEPTDTLLATWLPPRNPLEGIEWTPPRL